MARLGDSKILTDSYKILEVVLVKGILSIIKNDRNEYAVAESDRELKVGDILYYDENSNSLPISCILNGKDESVSILLISCFYY